jgi:hypothetical protein
MLSRLTRICLALVTVLVFTGQIEAAAQHCARLAEAAAIIEVAEPDTPPCHDSQGDAVGMHPGMSHAQDAPESPEQSGTAKSPPHCDCIAALTGWVDIAGATTTTQVEDYVWLVSVDAIFASSEPDPDLRPPRA